MKKFTIWAIATRPKTLIASVCPVLASAALAPILHWPLFYSLVATALGIQILCNFANDYFDFLKGADTFARKGPMRVTQAGLVTPKEMRWALGIVTTLTLLSGTHLVVQGGPLFAILVALAIALAYLYTAGPFPLAYLGLGDLFVFLFFGPVAVGTATFLMTGQWQALPFIVGLAPGALSTVLLTINNLRDVDEDRMAGKRTVIVRFGARVGKIECLVCLLLPFVVVHNTLIALGMAIPTLQLIKGIMRAKEPLDYPPLLPKAARLLAIFTLLFFLFWNF